MTSVFLFVNQMKVAFWISIQYTPEGIKLRVKFILKKISSRILVLLMMIGVFGLLSNTVTQAAAPEVVTVNIADLTKEQREAI